MLRTYKVTEPPAKFDETFKLGNSLDSMSSSEDDDGEMGFDTLLWNTLAGGNHSPRAKSREVDEDLWTEARQSVKECAGLETQRKAREATKLAETEEAMKQRFMDAVEHGKRIRTQRQEEQAREAAKEKEARDPARKAVRAQVESVVQTVDLEAQRALMTGYENLYGFGGATPSSDDELRF